MDEIKLGDQVMDSITGFVGIVVAKCRYLDGTVEYGLCSKELFEGKPIPTQWFNEKRIVATS